MVWPPDDRIRRTFAETARRYDDLARRRFRRIAREMVRVADVRRADRILDVASGSGLVGRILVENGFPAPVSIDISASLLSLAPLAMRVLGDASAIPMKDASFDVALCSLGIQMFEDPERALAEMRRVIRDGGRVALTTWGEENSMGEVNTEVTRHFDALVAERPGFDPARWQVPQVDVGSPHEMRDALEDAGFQDIEVAVRRKRSAFRGPGHYFDMLSIFPGTWARLQALGARADEAREDALEIITKGVGGNRPFEMTEEVLIASARR